MGASSTNVSAYLVMTGRAEGEHLVQGTDSSILVLVEDGQYFNVVPLDTLLEPYTGSRRVVREKGQWQYGVAGWTAL